MLVHTGSLLTVTLARLDAEANARQPTEFKFMLLDHSDDAFLELAAAVREHKAGIAAGFEEALQAPPAVIDGAVAVIEGQVVPAVTKPKRVRTRKAAPPK